MQEDPQEPIPPRPDTPQRGQPARRGVEFAGVELPEYLAIPIAILRLMTSVLGFGLGVRVSPSSPVVILARSLYASLVPFVLMKETVRVTDRGRSRMHDLIND
eukprot:4308907-Pyramimonas_sp.AAC.2